MQITTLQQGLEHVVKTSKSVLRINNIEFVYVG